MSAVPASDEIAKKKKEKVELKKKLHFNAKNGTLNGTVCVISGAWDALIMM